ncbi:hypothetical protein AGMMS49959_17770 [Planctomycetales bacterium]|nr:hypothetical protein AGMMS49959_17770 [Planctomycetales bacterium]
MKLGIMQPYFLPHIGYWQLIFAVDKYVVYDDVNYIMRGWINRNNLLVNNAKKLFTISVKNASQNRLINEIEITDDFIKFRKTVEYNYSKAPYYESVIHLLDTIIAFPERNLSAFIANSIREVSSYLDIHTEFVLSSSIKKDNSLKGRDKIIDICKLLGASDYYNAIGGQGLYDKSEFITHNIELYFLATNITPYKQFKNDFVAGLSILDVLMFNGKETVRAMLKEFSLV